MRRRDRYPSLPVLPEPVLSRLVGAVEPESWVVAVDEPVCWAWSPELACVLVGAESLVVESVVSGLVPDVVSVVAGVVSEPAGCAVTEPLVDGEVLVSDSCSCA